MSMRRTEKSWALLGWIRAILQGFCAEGGAVRGIGKALLDIVKEKKAELALHAYQKNEKAVRFYLREGFRIRREMIDEDTREEEYLMEWSKEAGKE